MTIKPILWYRVNKNKEYFIKIRITEKTKATYVNLNISVAKRYWNNGRITKGHPEADRLNRLIRETIYSLEQRLIPKNTNDKKLASTPNSTANDDKITFPKSSVGSMLKSFIDDFASKGKIGSAKKHKVVLNHAKAAGIDIIGLNEFDQSHIFRFRTYLTDHAKVQPQGRHTYEKIIKKVFSRAIEQGLREGHHPFLGMKFKVPKPKQPRHLSRYELHVMEERLIYRHHLSRNHHIALAMFLFSTYSYGMRFSDVATIRWSDIKDLTLDYKMRKTDEPIVLKITNKHANLIKDFLPEKLYPSIFSGRENIYNALVENKTNLKHPIIDLENEYMKMKVEFIERIATLPENKWNYDYVKKNNPFSNEERENLNNIVKKRDKVLLNLIDIQSKSSTDYIFPLLKKNYPSLTSEYNDISAKNVIINNELKDYAKVANIAPFSFHASRHSFANNIRDVEPDLLKISRMLGHKSLTLTQEYLKRFEKTEDYTSNQRFINSHDDILLLSPDKKA